MTPKQFVHLVERYREHRKQEDRRAGEVVAILYNINRDSDKDRYGKDWTDFFPEWKEETEQTEDEMLESMNLWAASTQALPS